MKKVFLNNSIVSDDIPLIYSNDRGFLLGDGLFETIKVENNKLFFFKMHYRRLVASAEKLSIPLIISSEQLLSYCNQVITANNLTESAALRITLTRGRSPRGIIIPEEQNPTLLIAAFPLTIDRTNYPTAFITDIQKNEYSKFTSLKTLNYLESIMAKQQAKKNGFTEGILLNTKGAITETSIANLFIVMDDIIKTPSISDGILPGIIREVILELARKNNLQIKEETILPVDLLQATEAFQTNSLLEIQSLSKINNIPLKFGKAAHITSSIMKLYNAHTKDIINS